MKVEKRANRGKIVLLNLYILGVALNGVVE